MDKKFLDLLDKARGLDVIDSGSSMVLQDVLRECRQKQIKNNETILRLKGQNDQLTFMQGMMQGILNKYILLQERHNKDEGREEEVVAEVVEPAPEPVAEEPKPKTIKDKYKSAKKRGMKKFEEA